MALLFFFTTFEEAPSLVSETKTVPFLYNIHIIYNKQPEKSDYVYSMLPFHSNTKVAPPNKDVHFLKCVSHPGVCYFHYFGIGTFAESKKSHIFLWIVSRGHSI